MEHERSQALGEGGRGRAQEASGGAGRQASCCHARGSIGSAGLALLLMVFNYVNQLRACAWHRLGIRQLAAELINK